VEFDARAGARMMGIDFGKGGGSLLKDIDEKGGMRELRDIDYREGFDRKWNEFSLDEQQAIDAEVTRLLDALRDSPDPLWGSIMNTSIKGGKVNPFNGLRSDWTGTPWHPIWERHGQSDQQAALFFGTLWKLRIIERRDRWIGIRNSDQRPTFPSRHVSLPGKTYFLESR
jgi:hypothetical protein